jgi:hypothetical protein
MIDWKERGFSGVLDISLALCSLRFLPKGHAKGRQLHNPDKIAAKPMAFSPVSCLFAAIVETDE